MTSQINGSFDDDENLSQLRAIGRELAEAQAPLLDIDDRLERILGGEPAATRSPGSYGATLSAYGDLIEFVHANTYPTGTPLPDDEAGRRAGPSDRFAAAITTRVMARELVATLRRCIAPGGRRRRDISSMIAACDTLILLLRVLPLLPDFTTTDALHDARLIGRILNARSDDSGRAFDPDLAVDLLGRTSGLDAAQLADAVEIAEMLSRELDATLVDATDLDLAGLQLDAPEILAGVVWTEQTAWPQRLEGWVRERSTRISGDTYQVRSKGKDDPGTDSNTGTQRVA